MYADTKPRPIPSAGSPRALIAALLQRLVARFARGNALPVAHLSESHLRDLGLTRSAKASQDTRPMIVLGPM